MKTILLITALLCTWLAGSLAMADTRVMPAAAPWQYSFAQQTGAPPPQNYQPPPQSYNAPAQPNASTFTQERAFNTVPINYQAPAEQPSSIESMYAQRIIEDLRQYGYEMFENQQASSQMQMLSEQTTGTPQSRAGSAAPPMGAIADDFILSYGDELEIVFTGQRNDRGVHSVNSEGLLLIKDFPPVPAAGRSIKQVREMIETSAHNQYNTQAYVALASVRQIGILVVGNVKKPGRKNMTAFHTVLDALIESGGIDKTGSLRQIKLIRGGRTTHVDLYALLMHGSSNVDLNLRDGDRIIVPAIGPTVAIAGEVKRPGIYEILPIMQGMRHEPQNTAEHLSLNDMLAFSGGVLAPGDNRFLKLGMSSEGQEIVEDVSEPFAPNFGDGAVLMVSKGEAKRLGRVEVKGHTRKPGMHALGENTTLSDLFSSADILGADIYPLLGVINRWDDDKLTHVLLDFPLRLVMKGDYDLILEDGDEITLFSNTQIRDLQSTILDEPETQTDQGSRPAPPNHTDNFKDNADKIPDDVIAFLKERDVFIRGAVRHPGPYPVAEGTTLDMALAVAGGLTLEASTRDIEVTTALNRAGNYGHGEPGARRLEVNFRETSPQTVSIQSGDAVRVNQKFKKIADKSVTLLGEVKYPGRYDLLPGDKVSDLLARAGGLTQQAYPDGAIFSRGSERKAEEARFRAQARMMRQAIATALNNGKDDEKNVTSGQIAEARALAAELEEIDGVGRITVESDPATLVAQPELDMLLETGDRLYIPKRGLTVRVSGEILSPASLQFREGKDPLDYIHEAGGFSYHADKERTFVLYPDGSAQPLQVSSWNYKPAFIPPGSTIVIPRDPKPFDFVSSFKDVTQILSNLAITGVFIDDIRD